MVLGQPLDTAVELLLLPFAVPDVTHVSNELQGVQRILLPSLHHTSPVFGDSALSMWLCKCALG